MIEFREHCYRCKRPKNCCLCKYIHPLQTRTKFVILMHPKEFKKTKNNTGKLTNLSLENSGIYVGIDFSKNDKINEIINDSDNNCFVLYPSKKSILLNQHSIKEDNKNIVIFIIDSTWPCSNKILRMSPNLQKLPYISFEHNKISQYMFKTQPNELSLSTMESTLCVLELLNKQSIETLSQKELEGFLLPFKQMVQYQMEFFDNPNKKQVRYKKPQSSV